MTETKKRTMKYEYSLSQRAESTNKMTAPSEVETKKLVAELKSYNQN